MLFTGATKPTVIEIILDSNIVELPPSHEDLEWLRVHAPDAVVENDPDEWLAVPPPGDPPGAILPIRTNNTDTPGNDYFSQTHHGDEDYDQPDFDPLANFPDAQPQYPPPPPFEEVVSSRGSFGSRPETILLQGKIKVTCAKGDPRATHLEL
ncbi:hypothetical protein HK102_012546, partial [Quaeritorhiza haematococci]